MVNRIPSPQEVAASLQSLGHAQIQRLAQLSGVPFTTLWKIRSEETEDPRLGTVVKILPHLKALQTPKGVQ